MQEIEENTYYLNISRYVSTAVSEPAIDLAATHRERVELEKALRLALRRHNGFLEDLGLAPLPAIAPKSPDK